MELQKRDDVYPRLVAKGQLRQSLADYHIARMKAVQKTLVWLRDNQAAVVQAHANIKADAEMKAAAEQGASA